LLQVALELEVDDGLSRALRKNKGGCRIMGCKSTRKNLMMILLELGGSRRRQQETLEDLREVNGINQIFVSRIAGRDAFCLLELQRPIGCGISIDFGAVCTHCMYGQGREKTLWSFIARSGNNARSLVSTVKERGIEVKHIAYLQLHQETSLTHRQREVLSSAISSGYFDFPRKLGLTELSRNMGVKPSTLCELLRKAERKLILDVDSHAGPYEYFVPKVPAPNFNQQHIGDS
jgi:predicted DNA binding protein